MEASDSALREGGRRLTPQRYMILHVIQDAHEHLSIEQIVKQVQERNPCVSQATIYRTLDLLQSLGLVRATHLAGKHVCYEVVKGMAHHHFVCRGCHSVLHLDPDLLGNLPMQLAQQYGFGVLTLELIATGYCETCWRSKQQKHDAATGREEFVPGARGELP